MSESITQAALRQLAAAWIGQGNTLGGPVRVQPDRVLYMRLSDAGRLLLDGFVRPSNSIKEFVFPRHETLYTYRYNGHNGVDLADCEPPSSEQLILGARPCDAAALPILGHVFNWDQRDELYNRRRALTTVVSIACARHDDSCFCTSVGGAPGNESGSDAMLYELGGGEYEVRTFTERGRALLAGHTQPGQRAASVASGPPAKFEHPEVAFDDPVFDETTLACLGCGVCSYTCPTCHCFDIVDQGGARGGARVRNWDACQFPMFTVHASGHNPRSRQGQRQRQRIYHKFHVYPEKFGAILCTGCGNCARNCPAGLGVLAVVEAMEARHE